jgi:hypothetical protein
MDPAALTVLQQSALLLRPLQDAAVHAARSLLTSMES